jgi:hypothetical protein
MVDYNGSHEYKNIYNNININKPNFQKKNSEESTPLRSSISI